MSRDLTGAVQAELASAQLAPAFFFEADFSGGYARAWSGVGTINWDGKLWLGNGNLIAMGQVDETRTLEATTLAVSLSGVNSALVATAYGEFSQGRPLTVWLGFINQVNGAVIPDPHQIFQGRMDTISDDDDGETATIVVSAESNLTDLKRLRARYHTDQDQQRLFPGDRSLRYMPSLQDKPIYWGAREGAPGLPQIS